MVGPGASATVFAVLAGGAVCGWVCGGVVGLGICQRSYRRHQTTSHQARRLKEDRNQHYDNLTCPCWTDKRAMARFKEQPQTCSQRCCGNPRKWEKGQDRLTVQERRFASEQEPLGVEFERVLYDSLWDLYVRG